MLVDKLKLLNYDNLWLEHDILTEELLRQQTIEFECGDDKNTEHYRYSAFTKYLQSKQGISETTIHKLFDIIKIDTDSVMANSMAIDILKTKSLTDSQFELVCEKTKQIFGDNMQLHIDREKGWREKRAHEK